jgi:hypothetical protein
MGGDTAPSVRMLFSTRPAVRGPDRPAGTAVNVLIGAIVLVVVTGATTTPVADQWPFRWRRSSRPVSMWNDWATATGGASFTAVARTRFCGSRR